MQNSIRYKQGQPKHNWERNERLTVQFHAHWLVFTVPYLMQKKLSRTPTTLMINFGMIGITLLRLPTN